MRPFFNLFFSIAIPVCIIFFIIATLYFSKNYELTEAIKLGVIAGFISGLGVSLITASTLLFTKKIRKEDTTTTKSESPLVQEPSSEPIDNSMILLMDRELAFEVALHSIIDQNIGKVTQGSKDEGTIGIHTPEQSINLTVSSLTKHTSQLRVKANLYNTSVEKIINYLKLKEQSFLQY